MSTFLSGPAGFIDVAAPLVDNHATQENVTSALRALVQKVSVPNAFGVFFYSGHGWADSYGSMICPYGWPNATLYGSDLLAIIEPMRRSGGQLLCIFDACHSGGIAPLQGMRIKSPRKAEIPTDHAIPPLFEPFDGVTVMTACSISQETWDGGAPPFATHDEGPGGVYTYALLQTLRANIKSELHAVNNAVSTLLNTPPFHQDPRIAQTSTREVALPHGVTDVQ